MLWPLDIGNHYGRLPPPPHASSNSVTSNKLNILKRKLYQFNLETHSNL